MSSTGGQGWLPTTRHLLVTSIMSILPTLGSTTADLPEIVRGERVVGPLAVPVTASVSGAGDVVASSCVWVGVFCTSRSEGIQTVTLRLSVALEIHLARGLFLVVVDFLGPSYLGASYSYETGPWTWKPGQLITGSPRQM